MQLNEQSLELETSMEIFWQHVNEIYKLLQDDYHSDDHGDHKVDDEDV